ncbi:hypothetical protein KKI93_17675 [Xenorhabdus bovienii]|uniref:hypothetical protein n=1 Tax=Xenorhabdus bovienii TaxID=40576 RepID=UPI0023B2C43C|nr:hypothetical protein [Xenorhabdus bovienii]MDE9565836.1 hypothetical protein [Xenorhabdus bovienii]
MKNIILYLGFLFISGCTVLNPPESNAVTFDRKDTQALQAIVTLFNEDKIGYESGKDSLVNWDKAKLKGNEVTKDNIANLIAGSKDQTSSKAKDASLALYSMYYLLRLINPTEPCSSETCVWKLLEFGASIMMKSGDQHFLASYEADNEKFKFANYDPQRSLELANEFASELVKDKEASEQQEIEENSKLPDTQPFEFKYINDKYVNAALALINTAKLEKHNIKDKNGNKTKEYRKPTIYGKPFFGDLYLYPRALLKQARSCEKASAYVRANIDNACKSAIVAGVKDWIGTARDPNISDVAWRAAANNAIIGDSIMFSHWAGMARVHQKSLNETGRISF